MARLGGGHLIGQRFGVSDDAAQLAGDLAELGGQCLRLQAQPTGRRRPTWITMSVSLVVRPSGGNLKATAHRTDRAVVPTAARSEALLSLITMPSVS